MSKKTTDPQQMLYDNPALNKSKAKKPAAPFSAPISEVHLVPLDLIDTPEQIRKEFDQESIDHLAKDIEARGLLQPILLNPHGERFQLIAGERRLRAVKLNGAAGIPALIVKTTTEEAMLMQLAENIQREELTLEEECEAVCKLYESLGSLAKVAETVKKSVPWCSKRYAMSQNDLCWMAHDLLEKGITEDIDLLKALTTLEPLIRYSEMQEWIKKIKEGEAGRKDIREALKLAKDKAKEEKTAREAKNDELSHAKPKEPPPPPPWEIDDAMENLSQALNYSDNELSAIDLLNTWTNEQRSQVIDKLTAARSLGSSEKGFKTISHLIMHGFYKTPYIDIELAAMVWGFGNQLFDIDAFLAQLQCPREKA